MKIVLDTNILLVSISQKSPLHWIYQNLKSGKYTLCVTTEIMFEYAEIIERQMGAKASQEAIMSLKKFENVIYIDSQFRFQLLKDEDDNKFVDCAIVANAHYLVSHDNDFKVLKTIPYPKVNLISIPEFSQVMKDLDSSQ